MRDLTCTDDMHFGSTFCYQNFVNDVAAACSERLSDGLCSQPIVSTRTFRSGSKIVLWLDEYEAAFEGHIETVSVGEDGREVAQINFNDAPVLAAPRTYAVEDLWRLNAFALKKRVEELEDRVSTSIAAPVSAHKSNFRVSDEDMSCDKGDAFSKENYLRRLDEKDALISAMGGTIDRLSRRICHLELVAAHKSATMQQILDNDSRIEAIERSFSRSSSEMVGTLKRLESLIEARSILESEASTQFPVYSSVELFPESSTKLPAESSVKSPQLSPVVSSIGSSAVAFTDSATRLTMEPSVEMETSMGVPSDLCTKASAKSENEATSTKSPTSIFSRSSLETPSHSSDETPSKRPIDALSRSSVEAPLESSAYVPPESSLGLLTRPSVKAPSKFSPRDADAKSRASVVSPAAPPKTSLNPSLTRRPVRLFTDVESRGVVVGGNGMSSDNTIDLNLTKHGVSEVVSVKDESADSDEAEFGENGEMVPRRRMAHYYSRVPSLLSSPSTGTHRRSRHGLFTTPPPPVPHARSVSRVPKPQSFAGMHAGLHKV